MSMGLDTFEIPSSEFGAIDQRRNNVPISLTFQPVGVINAQLIPIYWPHLSLPIGASLFGADDATCEIFPVDGKEALTLKAVAITNMPDIIISATKTTLGELTMTSLLGNEASWSDATARYAYFATKNFPSPGEIDIANIPTMPAHVAWGDGFTDIKTGEGVTFAFNMETNNEECDEDGIFDVTLSNISVSATLSPLTTTVGALLTRMGLQGAGVLRGTSTAGHDLTGQASRIGGLKVKLPSARLANLPLNFGMTSRRIGELTFQGFRTGGSAAEISMVTAADIQARTTPPTAPATGGGDEG